MSPEQVPELSKERAEEFVARGSALIETNDAYNPGRLVAPSGENNPIDRMAEDDKSRYDALEAAKSGKLEGITDPTVKAALTERFKQEGQKGLESLIEAMQKGIASEPIDPEKLGALVAETQLGTNANGTPEMK